MAFVFLRLHSLNFNLALVFPMVGIPGLFEARMVDIMTPFVATLLGLGMKSPAGPIAAILIGGVVCCAAAIWR